MGTNIYIQSDFIEPYDKYLHDPMGKIRWKRLSRGGRNRREIFELLHNYVGSVGGFRDNVIPNGTVQELYYKYKEKYVNGLWNATWHKMGIQSPFRELVIYKDEMAHRGEGKEVENAEIATEDYPSSYASVFLSSDEKFPISYRLLYIGNREYKLTYVSLTDDWRSNCGYVVILYEGLNIYRDSHYKDSDYIHFTRKTGTVIESPIFSFDYIKIPVVRDGCPFGLPERFFVDFNEAPGIPEEVIINDCNDERRGDLIPFSEIISFEDISKCIEKTLKSENK